MYKVNFEKKVKKVGSKNSKKNVENRDKKSFGLKNVTKKYNVMI